jgi:hypothetical protein
MQIAIQYFCVGILSMMILCTIVHEVTSDKFFLYSTSSSDVDSSFETMNSLAKEVNLKDRLNVADKFASTYSGLKALEAFADQISHHNHHRHHILAERRQKLLLRSRDFARTRKMEPRSDVPLPP